ncbi:unnamed protein product [Timema podura]|uniref:Proline-rich protein PRCC n=1 Tax=Timema podura TaxID=61482 RepID=A0ABN7P446_TIMPD|nr:unnamed protein product [Timema podura]
MFVQHRDESRIFERGGVTRKSSGLFALLPAPKHMTVKEAKRNLVPNAVSKKPTKTINSSPSTHKPKTTAALINYVDSGDDSDENNDGNFFSLNDDSAPKTEHLLLNETLIGSGTDTLLSTGVEDSTNNVAIDQPLTFCSEFHPSTLSNSNEEWQQQSMSSTEMKNDILLDEEARLCGRRATRDKQAMQIIDVSGDAIMPDPNEWLTKQLTEEQQQKSHSHSHRKNEGPTTQQRRKHQITYLAFQAKENELELKNQWSQNRMSRKQTQSKYGF